MGEIQIPVPTASVNSELERLMASAQDALTDDMVTRLSANLSQSLDVLDRFNRSGIDRAIPVLARLVENGDLERLVDLARLWGSVEDSLSDDIVSRLALVVTELASLVDKLARNQGFQRLIDLLGQADVQATMVGMLSAISAAKTESDSLPPAKGGLGGLWQIATDPGSQQVLRFMMLVCKHFNKK